MTTLPSIAAVILAAGASRRLGRPKQLLRYREETLVHRAARLALEAGCRPVIVVLGAGAGEIGEAIADLEVDPVFNPDWREGMGSSVRAGIEALPESVQAALVLLTDQPYLDEALLEQLLAAYRTGTTPLVASDYGQLTGVPAIFDCRLFPELIQLSGDRGARSLIRKYAGQLTTISFPGGRIDLDTEEDWQAFLAGE